MANYAAIFGRAARFNPTLPNRALCAALTERSEILNAEFAKGLIDPKRTAHLVVDPQELFVKDRNEDSAARISGMAGFCRDAGIRNYWFWMPYLSRQFRAGHPDIFSAPDFYGAQPDPEKGDIVMPKLSSSSFKGTTLGEQLNGGRIATVVLSGYCSGACVLETALAARELDYRTIIATDCSDAHLLIENNLFDARRLHDAGVFLTTSDEIRRGLRPEAPSMATPAPP